MANPFRLVAPLGRRTIWHKAGAPHPDSWNCVEDRVTRAHREKQLFCDLSPAAAGRLAAIASALSYAQGAVLFTEGQAPCGVFVLLEGRVKLSFASARSRALALRIAGPGDALGLSATLLGKPYEVTAEALDPLRTDFIGRQDFLEFLREHNDAAACVARYSTWVYEWVLAEMRRVGLKLSSEERILRLLLHRSDGPHKGAPVRRLHLAPEEIGPAIGASRASVERILGHLKRRRIVQMKGSTLIIRNRAAIERLAAQT